MTYYRYRQGVNLFAFAVTGFCALITLAVLFFVLGYVTTHGLSAINIDFLIRLPKPVGEAGGGMANAIIGTFKLLLFACLFGLPIGVLGGVYLGEFGDNAVGFLFATRQILSMAFPPSLSAFLHTRWWFCRCATFPPSQAVSLWALC